MQVWTVASGKTAVIASGKPFRPSTTAISTSSTPRFLSSVMTRSQNLAPSVCSIHSPRISLVPSARTPSATWTALLVLPAPTRAPLGLPRLDRLARKPDRQAATPAQALVVIAPVRDLALLLRDVVASVLVQLEGQGGHPGSDGGLPCYLDRAQGATRGIPATTCCRRARAV